MKTTILSSTVILFGLISIGYGLFIVITSEGIEFGGKYTPEGRDSGFIILSLIIGACSVLYGVISLALHKEPKTEPKKIER